ncbi:MAG: HAMP domain-containing protein [Candidatus Scalindua rubra]|nr:HAMP domain-containing protein [Candidatus Scalindua rubra]TWU35501.1 putative sensor histidine kinase pdtaS [Candidatus Brocadiaceae bacterium S225]
MRYTKVGFKLFCLFLLMSLVPLGIAGTIVYKHVHDRTRDEVFGQLRSMSYSLNNQLGLLLSKRRCRVADFSSDGFIRDRVEQINQMPPESFQINEELNTHLIVNKKRLDPDILEIEILNQKGKVIASTSKEEIGADRSHEDYFRIPFVLLENKGPYFSDALQSSETRDAFHLVFSTLLTERILQRPLGVIVTKVKGDILQGVLNQYMHHPDKEGFGPFGEIYIVNRDKIKIADASNGVIFNQIVDTKEVQEVLVSKEELSDIYKNYKGVPVLGSALFVPEANWVIIAEKSVKEAFLPLTKIKYIFVFSGGGVFFLVLFLGFVISAKMNVIIKKMTEGIKRIANGNLEHPIAIGKRNDEIGEVVESFNSMTIKLKELLNEKELLMREIFHRVKNNMQVISSLLSLQCKYIKDEKYIEMVKESQDRIKAMALIHENLYRSKDLSNIDFNDYVKSLVNGLLLSYKMDTNKITLKINIKTFFFAIETAIPCGLIINELISNSLKYAFPEGRDGEINISLRSLDNDELEIIVSNDGVNFPNDLDFRDTESLGLRLVTNLAENQLHGKIELNRSKGTEFKIRFKEIKYKKRM